jgi:putative transposase
VDRLFKCPRCGFELDRQKLASINIYLKQPKTHQDAGIPHINEPDKYMRMEVWVGVTPS